ncbi:hypothetical protein ANN_19957, partial [Periplaneta americana]
LHHQCIYHHYRLHHYHRLHHHHHFCTTCCLSRISQLNCSRKENGEAIVEKMTSGLTVPVYVARTREPLRLSKGSVDPRFPDGLPYTGDAAHALYQPVVQTDGHLAAVVELWRSDPFHEEDEEIASSYLVWGGIALHYAQLYLSMNKQRKLNDFLLAVVKSIFQDMVSMDALIMKIMNFAQRLVDADRASLFLVDSKNKELYARIFDIGVASENVSNNTTGASDSGGEDAVAKLQNSTEIRFVSFFFSQYQTWAFKEMRRTTPIAATRITC